jgi:hypothetical protein
LPGCVVVVVVVVVVEVEELGGDVTPGDVVEGADERRPTRSTTVDPFCTSLPELGLC